MTQPIPDMPIDISRLLENCMGNAELVSLVFDKFEKQAREQLSQISESLDANDIARVARTSHSIKGAAGALTATAVQEAAARIELAARAGDIENITASIAQLRREVESFLSYLPTARASVAKSSVMFKPHQGSKS